VFDIFPREAVITMPYIKISIFICMSALLFFQEACFAGSEPDGYYSIHGGSYRDNKNAEAYRASIEKRGWPAFVQKVDLKEKGIWYRVYIGRYNDLKTAKQAIVSLKRHRIEDLGFVRKFSANPPKLPVTLKKTGANGDREAKNRRQKVTKPREIKANIPIARLAESRVAESNAAKDKPRNAAAVNIPAADHQKDEKMQSDSAGKNQVPSVLEEGKQGIPFLDASPALLEARNAFQSERYVEAIDLLNGLIGQGHSDKRVIDAAIRMKASSLYHIGVKGDPQGLMKAVDAYKDVIKNYPDPAEGNDLAYRHMAQCYEELNFFYEAAAAWNEIVAEYPNSRYFEEALFKSGHSLISTRKNETVCERLNNYIRQYPNGVYAKQAHYALGEILYGMRKFDQAGKWFNSARKKWPDMSDVPRKTLYNIGSYYFKVAGYDDAFEVFSFLANLCPDDDFGKKSLLMMAKAAEMNKNPGLMLKLCALFIEKYPKSSEAVEAALSIANLGVFNPGVKAKDNIWSMDDYVNPFKAYERLLAKGEGDMEQVLFSKGNALEKKGNLDDAFNLYLTILDKHPQGRFSQQVLRSLRTLIVGLTDKHYAEGDDKAVATLYFKTIDHFRLEDAFSAGIKMGRSLIRLGFYEEAKNVFDNLRNDDNGELELAVAEWNIAMGNMNIAEQTLNLLAEKRPRGDSKKMLQKAYENLAYHYLMTENYDKALATYEKIIRSDFHKADAVFYLHYGRSLQAKKMTREALKNYTMALACCESVADSCENRILSDIHRGLGDVYAALSRFTDAIATYQKALQYVADEKGKRWLLLRIGQTYAGMNNFSRAQKSFSQMKETPDGEFWPVIADFFISQHMPYTSMENVNE
jgi:tetratricopeptide (TPR) repeat protein